MINRESRSVLVRVWLLGAFRADRRNHDGTWEAIEKTAWDKNYARQLLNRLLCANSRRATRSDIIDDLWPERSFQLAEKYLNNASSKLSSMLVHEGILKSFCPHGSGGYQLADQALLWTDITECEWLLQEAERLGRTSADTLSLLEHASHNFERGGMLEGEGGQWCLAVRTQAEMAMRCCGIWLAEAYEARQMLWNARVQYRKLIGADPLDEDALCRLLALLHRHGMAREALACYEEAKQRFATDGLSLSPTTAALAQKVASEPASPEQYLTLSPIPAVSLDRFTPVVQLLHMQQAALPEKVSKEQDQLTSSEQSILLPLALPVQIPSIESASFDSAAWFGARINELKTCGAFLHELMACQQQQTLVHAEMETWSTMTDQDDQLSHEYLISRRTALAALAMLSSSLLTKIQCGPLTAVIIEEFLSQCATSITTCWHLMQGRELTIVQQALTRYLPMLSSWATRRSPYQQTSAYLASQGCLLIGLLSLHSLPKPQNYQQRLFYCTQAAEYARLSADPTLLVTALTHLANAHYDMRHLEKMLQTYQEAVSTLDDFSEQYQIPLLLSSKLQAGLAHAYAQHGEVQQALRALEEAGALFPHKQEAIPVFLATDYGQYSRILFEGRTHLDLEKHAPKDNHPHQAATALAQIETISMNEYTPERFRVEILNQRALAAIREGDRDGFEKYYLEGTKGAQALASEKRRQEAFANWQAARKQWPHESRIVQLADVLF